MNEPTADDITKALGAFLICFGQGLPAPLKQQIRDRCYQMAEQIEKNGEPTVARLARGYGDCLTGTYLPPASH